MAKEEMNIDQAGKLKALQAAMSKIEKDFGKGSIMKLGDEQVENVEVIPTGSIGLTPHSVSAATRRAESSRYTVPSRQVRQRLPYTPSPRHRRQAASLHSSTPSTPSTASTLQSSA